jgi:hypothetical protein
MDRRPFQRYFENLKKLIFHKKTNWSKKKMADKIKMAVKHEFSITLSTFMQIN